MNAGASDIRKPRSRVAKLRTRAALLLAGAAFFSALIGVLVIAIELATPNNPLRIPGAPPTDIVTLRPLPNQLETAVGIITTRRNDHHWFGFKTTAVHTTSKKTQRLTYLTDPLTSHRNSALLIRVHKMALVVGVQTGPATAGVYSWSGPGMLLFAGALAPAALLVAWPSLRARRRRKAGVCPKCAYDLSGLDASAPCPECGALR